MANEFKIKNGLISQGSVIVQDDNQQYLNIDTGSGAIQNTFNPTYGLFKVQDTNTGYIQANSYLSLPYVNLGDIDGNYNNTTLTIDDYNRTIHLNASQLIAPNVGTISNAINVYAQDPNTGYLKLISTSSLQVASASYALTASYVANASSFPFTGSAKITGSLTVIGPTTITGSLLVTGSNVLIGTKTITGSVFISGSKTIIGNNTITGSLNVFGSSTFSGSLNVTNGITGSLLGTASYATTASYVQNAQTASYVLNSISSSYALTASYVANASSFPFTGSAIITGSFKVIGSTVVTGSTTLSGSTTLIGPTIINGLPINTAGLNLANFYNFF